MGDGGIVDLNGGKTKAGAIADDDIKIEYRDEYGRIPTAKEQFRILSHRFHGKDSGYKNKEKRMQKIEKELRLQKRGNEAAPTMEALLKNQQKDNKAHMILS